jgi:hypothetical protein
VLELQITLKNSEIRKRATLVKRALIDEFRNYKVGSSFSEQALYEVYTYQDYKICVGKPGKEVLSQNIKYADGYKGNNPNDMTPRILKGGELVVYDGSFEAIFKQFVRIHDSVEALSILGAMLYRNALLLDHHKINDRWRYTPSMTALQKIKETCSIFLSLPIEVFLFYLELIALNEDVKYDTLGYDINKGFGRKNNLLTYVNLIHVMVQKHFLSEEEFLLGFMSFAGRLTSPPAGLNPISTKQALVSFPFLKGLS